MTVSCKFHLVYNDQTIHIIISPVMKIMLSSEAALNPRNGRGKGVLSLQASSPGWRVSVEERPTPPMTT